MAVLQVRNMDDELYGTLKRRAAMGKRSISQEVVTILQQHLSVPKQVECADDIALSLAGSWEDDRTADEIIADIYSQRRSKSTRHIPELL